MTNWYCKGRTPGRGVVSSNHSQDMKKDINKPERWLSSGQMLCERLPYPNWELNALEPTTQNPHCSS